MKKKARVAIVFGGRSAEHEVSLQSAKNIITAIDRTKYDPVLIAIDRTGDWYLNDDSLPILNGGDPRTITLNRSNSEIAVIPNRGRGELIRTGSTRDTDAIDVLFPVLHGPYGEDGSIQGLSKLANLPCVGSGILGSAVAMDKDISKRLLRGAGVAVADYIVVRDPELHLDDAKRIGEKLGFPLFVKPANLGSSVGVNRADDTTQLIAAVREASQFDTKILVEQFIAGRELECAVLGNDEPEASVAGEIVASDRFYSYEAKYIDENGAALVIPAQLDPATLRAVQETAIESFRTLECRGMARVDMFLTDEGRLYVNEVNTIPGFTRISMYPKLWEATGLSYPDLIDRLIQLAIEEHARQAALKVTRE